MGRGSRGGGGPEAQSKGRQSAEQTGLGGALSPRRDLERPGQGCGKGAEEGAEVGEGRLYQLGSASAQRGPTRLGWGHRWSEHPCSPAEPPRLPLRTQTQAPAWPAGRPQVGHPRPAASPPWIYPAQAPASSLNLDQKSGPA